MRKSTSKNNLILSVVLVFLLALVLIVFVGCKKDQPHEAQQAIESQKTYTSSEKVDLRILYAGLPNTDRSKDFVDFLTKYFQQVETTDYNTFRGSHTADFDVAIIDHDGADTRAPRPNISRQYARATVTVGVPGAFICSQLSLKTGYL